MKSEVRFVVMNVNQMGRNVYTTSLIERSKRRRLP